MKRAIDAYVVYQFLKRLATPFTASPAYKLGIIDAQGHVLRKRATLKTDEEKKAYTYFDTLVFNLKKLIIKLGGESKIVTYAAALLLIKEQNNKAAAFFTEEKLQKCLNRQIKQLRHIQIREEAPTNNIGSGNIKGTDAVGQKVLRRPKNFRDFRKAIGKKK